MKHLHNYKLFNEEVNNWKEVEHFKEKLINLLDKMESHNKIGEFNKKHSKKVFKLEDRESSSPWGETRFVCIKKKKNTKSLWEIHMEHDYRNHDDILSTYKVLGNDSLLSDIDEWYKFILDSFTNVNNIMKKINK